MAVNVLFENVFTVGARVFRRSQKLQIERASCVLLFQSLLFQTGTGSRKSPSHGEERHTGV